MLCLQNRYGAFRGLTPEVREDAVTKVPSLEMVKKEGRSNIAFAIQRYHNGERAFAGRHGMAIGEDTVHVRPIGTLGKSGPASRASSSTGSHVRRRCHDV